MFGVWGFRVQGLGFEVERELFSVPMLQESHRALGRSQSRIGEHQEAWGAANAREPTRMRTLTASLQWMRCQTLPSEPFSVKELLSEVNIRLRPHATKAVQKPDNKLSSNEVGSTPCRIACPLLATGSEWRTLHATTTPFQAWKLAHAHLQTRDTQFIEQGNSHE